MAGGLVLAYDDLLMSAASDFASAVLKAWQGDLGFLDLMNHAAALDGEGLPSLSAVLYRTWLSRNRSDTAYVAWFNLGSVLFNLGDNEGAADAYQQAISLASGFVQPRVNLGLVHERAGRLADAVEQWRWVADHCPDSADTRGLLVTALNHIGRVQEGRKHMAEALEALTRSLTLDPAQPDVLHHWVFMRQKQCLWPVYDPLPGVGVDAMRAATSALAMLSISDEPQAQLEAARHYVRTKLAADLPRLAPERGYGHPRIRIGYCSSDFCLHPVSLLMVQLFELHDRQAFEVYGYCWSPEDGSAMRQRVITGMDHFHRIHSMSDEQAARLIRSHEIDVLIDLQGQTAGARANLLGYRPAPIQITYLGLPATTGLPSIDWVIADEFLIPPGDAAFYSEKPLYMPDVYQVSDRQRLEGPTPTRAACGLPDDTFVFCSFNNSFKVTPDVFACWMRILRRVPSAVLWLLADNEWAEANLRREAQQAGIDTSRLIFAGRVSPENYLARFRVADLFLDSFPFNAGTTANDCLWMGCPIVTLAGRSFASRMAGALLTAAGLPELITGSLTEYEALAVALADDPARVRQLRAHLAGVREHGVLFDTPRFARALDSRLIGLVRDREHSEPLPGPVARE